AGFAQSSLEERHPHVQMMFMLGCAGDSNPYPRGTMELARKHGQVLAEEVSRVMAGKLRPVHGPLQIAFDRADLPLQSNLTRQELEQIAKDKRSAKAFGAARMLAILDRGEKPPSHYNAPLTVWQFGRD